LQTLNGSTLLEDVHEREVRSSVFSTRRMEN